MKSNNDYTLHSSVVLVPFFSVLLIWTVYWMELKLGINLNEFGVRPRTIEGLRGIILSPLIHGSREHLYNNSIPLVVLTAALFYFYKKVAWRVLIIGIILSGIITWIIGRPSFHIGASGLIYVLVSFIFFKGIFTKYFRLIALSLAVVFLYGSMIWYIFPIEEGISWEGHLSGFLVGLALAYFLTAPIPQEKKFAWQKEDYNEEEDEFMKHFDADGNFIETSDENLDQEIKITYHYKNQESSSSKNNRGEVL